MGTQMMTINELAEFLQVKVDTVYHWRYRRKGPKGYKVGGQIRYRMADVEAWLEANADA